MPLVQFAIILIKQKCYFKVRVYLCRKAKNSVVSATRGNKHRGPETERDQQRGEHKIARKNRHDKIENASVHCSDSKVTIEWLSSTISSLIRLRAGSRFSFFSQSFKNSIVFRCASISFFLLTPLFPLSAMSFACRAS